MKKAIASVKSVFFGGSISVSKKNGVCTEAGGGTVCGNSSVDQDLGGNPNGSVTYSHPIGCC